MAALWPLDLANSHVTLYSVLVSGGGGTWIKRYREGVGTGISGVFEGTGIVFWSEGTGNFTIFDNFYY